jgi:hypothetical protein
MTLLDNTHHHDPEDALRVRLQELPQPGAIWLPAMDVGGGARRCVSVMLDACLIVNNRVIVL